MVCLLPFILLGEGRISLSLDLLLVTRREEGEEGGLRILNFLVHSLLPTGCPPIYCVGEEERRGGVTLGFVYTTRGRKPPFLSLFRGVDIFPDYQELTM